MSRERGSVSIVVAAMMSAVVVMALGAADVARVFMAASRAQTAADAAALAAAQELAFPEGALAPDELAASYAAKNGAVLEGCVCGSGSFEAEVTVGAPAGPMFLVADDLYVTARARAVVDLPSN